MCQAFAGLTVCDLVRLQANGSSPFAFVDGALTSPGTYIDTYGLFSGTLTITETDAAVPEPATAGLLPMSLAGLGVLRRGLREAGARQGLGRS